MQLSVTNRSKHPLSTAWIQIRANIIVGPDLGPSCLHVLSADTSQRINLVRVLNIKYNLGK